MKILIIKSSPNKKGSSNILADEFMRGAKEKGHEVIEFDAGHANINPCRGCNSCGMGGACVQKDDMENELKDLIRNNDMLVFVTPLYYFGMTAQIKTVIDRFYSFTGELTSMHKRTALITVAWDSEESSFEFLKQHYQKLCSYMQFDNRGMIIGKGCGTTSMTKSSEYVQKSYEFGRSI